jgi:low temperature requirement protein LtrA
VLDPAENEGSPFHHAAAHHLASIVARVDERRTGPVELLWDLVFVFAVTQTTTLISKHLTWGGFLHGMIVLALVWWAWSAFVWAANAEDEESRPLRIVLVVAMVLVFVVGIALPSAFQQHATLFAVAYSAVRALHIALYAVASRRGNASWSAINGFAIAVAAGMGLLVAGSFLRESLQVASWLAALAIDYAGPAWLTRERLRGLQQVAIAHFAERYGLFVIICLGESIVAIGLSSDAHAIDARLVATAALGLLATVALWWLYFDRFAGVAERRLRDHHDVVLVAADGYSYLHLPIVAGVIVFAVGMKVALVAGGDTLTDGARLALCGGLALYLAGNVAFRLRLGSRLAWPLTGGVAALAVLFAGGGPLSALWVTALAAAALVCVCALEVRYPTVARTSS